MIIRPQINFPTELILLGLTVFGSCAFIAARVFFPG